MKSSKIIYIVLFFIVCPLYSQPSDLLWHLPGTQSLQIRAIGAPGDINLDGFDDVIILRVYNDNDTIPNYLELYFGGNPMDTTPDFIYNYNVSMSTKPVPNLNGDTIPDFMIGPDIYFGGLPLSNEPDISLPMGDNTDFPSLAYPYIGDLNNDGYSDIKGTTHFHNDYFDMVTLHFGGQNMDSIPDYIWDIPNVTSWEPLYPMMFNDDMIHDFNLKFYSNEFDSTFLFYGSDSFTTEPDSIRYNATYTTYVDDFTGDGYPEFYSTLPSEGTDYDRKVIYNGGPGGNDTSNVNAVLQVWGDNLLELTPTGDVNGDGFNDFVLRGYHSVSNLGAVHLYLGGPTVRSTPVAIWTGGYSGPPAIGAGRSAKNVGDVNGDGLDDIFFLSRNDFEQPKGHAYIYSGDSSWVNPYVYMDIEKSTEVPNHFSIDAPYPNPFNARVIIPYELTKDASIDLQVFNIKGSLVDQLFKGHQISGKHEIIWDASAFASGVYFIQLESDMYKKHQKVMLIK